LKSVFIVLFLCVVLFGCGAATKQMSPIPFGVGNGAAGTRSSTGSGASSSSPSTPSAGATMQCGPGEYDMLDWATLDPDLAAGFHMEGNANPLYTVVQNDKFYWIKSATGYPWDIQLTDKNNIYLWVTEQDWNDPHTFKKSDKNTNMPLTSRCAKGGQSQPGTSIKSKDTSFDTVNRCATTTVSNLGTMVNDVWGPFKMSFGGDLPANMDTLIVSYRYDCDANYGNCADREQFYLSQRYGLVRWDHGKLINGQYVLDNFTVYNKLVAGGPPTPIFPCN